MRHQVWEHKLGNGARGLVVHMPDSPAVDMTVVFNSGFLFADPVKFEVPHVMEHMMFSGNKKLPGKNEFSTEVEKNGAHHNASTSLYINTYDYLCADFEADRILELMAAQITSPLFPDNYLVTEVGNVREELARNTTSYPRLLNNHLMAKLSPVGSQEYEKRLATLGDITTDDIWRHYRATHVAANMWFFFAGDFPDKGEEFVGRFESLTRELPKGKRLDIVDKPWLKLGAPFLESADIKQLYYAVQVDFQSEGEQERLAMGLLSNVLTTGFRSRVLGQARERGIAYSVSSCFSHGYGWDDFGFGGNVTPANAKPLFHLIATEVSRIQEGDLTEEELTAAKDIKLGRHMLRHQTASDYLGWYSGYYLVHGEVRNYQEWLEDLRSVPVEAVVEAARRLGDKPWELGVLGDIQSDQAKELYRALEPIWQNR